MAVGVVGGLIAAYVAVSEYRLKSIAQRAELDIRLARLFAEIVPIANGRAGHVVSETAAAAIVKDRKEITTDLLHDAVISLPVGVPTQAAAIRSIGRLGADYPGLRGSAEGALRALAYVDEVAALKAARAAAVADIAPEDAARRR